jgi:glycosyltransferase involved in cell wall biosynthesis
MSPNLFEMPPSDKSTDNPDGQPFRLAVLGLGRYSGAGKISLQLTKELAGRAEVLALISEEALNRDDWERASLSNSFRLITKSTYDSIREAILQSVIPVRIFAIGCAIRKFRPDAVLVPMTHLWILPLMYLIRRTAWIVVVHDPYPHPGKTARFMNSMDRLVARKADRIVTHSKRFVAVVSDSFGIEIGRVCAIPLGPLSNDANDLLVRDRTLPAQNGRPFVALCFGRIEAYKGIEVLLQAAPLVEAQRPDITIRIVGRGADASITAAVAAFSNVELDTRWVEESEIAEIFAAANVVVLPYTSATQSGVIPQAATFGLPVICSDVGGLAEQLNDGVCGILIPPNDPKTLAESILRCANDPAEAALLGEALRTEYAENRSWSKIADKFVEVAKQAKISSQLGQNQP